MSDDVTNEKKESSPSLAALAEFTPRTLVLDLLSVARGTPMPAPALAKGGQIMGFKGGSIRVATSRLAAQGLIDSPRRGEWQLAEQVPWAREQARWRDLNQLLVDWTGRWWVIVTHRVSRSNRSAWRKHERALLQRGFREAERDVFVRPANLTASFEALWQQLTNLGMEANSLMLDAAELSFQPSPTLWNSNWRQRVLEEALREMHALIDHPGEESDEQRCAHFLKVGRAAVRMLNTDPLLPEDWAGPSSRRDVAALMPRFIEVGRALWFQHLGIKGE